MVGFFGTGMVYWATVSIAGTAALLSSPPGTLSALHCKPMQATLVIHLLRDETSGENRLYILSPPGPLSVLHCKPMQRTVMQYTAQEYMYSTLI